MQQSLNNVQNQKEIDFDFLCLKTILV
jgi:hypothetical protein